MFKDPPRFQGRWLMPAPRHQSSPDADPRSSTGSKRRREAQWAAERQARVVAKPGARWQPAQAGPGRYHPQGSTQTASNAALGIAGQRVLCWRLATPGCRRPRDHSIPTEPCPQGGNGPPRLRGRRREPAQGPDAASPARRYGTAQASTAGVGGGTAGQRPRGRCRVSDRPLLIWASRLPR